MNILAKETKLTRIEINFEQNKAAKAEKVYFRVLKDREIMLKSNYRSILSIIGTLGNLYFKQGKIIEAGKIYLRVLEVYEDTYSPELASTYPPALNTILTLEKPSRELTGKISHGRCIIEHCLGTQALKNSPRSGPGVLKNSFKRCKLYLLSQI